MAVTLNKLLQVSLIIVLLCLIIPSYSDEDVTTVKVEEENESESMKQNPDVSKENTSPSGSKLSPMNLYRRKFSHYRHMQQQAMQTVFSKATQKTRLVGLVESVLTKLFQVVMDAKANLTKVGYVAGDDFPDEEDTRESLSKVLENTFMFADTLLRRPTLVHSKYDAQQEWKAALAWAYHVSLRAGVIGAEEGVYLDLMAKEAGILPKDASFENPYLDDSEKPRKKFEDPKPREKKKPKKKHRGPRLSHSEL